MKDYFRYWGKALKKDKEDGGDVAYHLLPYHALDVAAVGYLLLSPNKPLCQQLATKLGVQPEWLQKFFVFCLALHDLGKFSSSFQGLQQGMSEMLVTANPRMPYSERHDTLGFMLWKKHLLPNMKPQYSWFIHAEGWMEIVTGHHGEPPKKSGIRIANFFEQEDQEAAKCFVQDMCHLFLADFDASPLQDKQLRQPLKSASWQLAGVAVLADWLGSNRIHFKYINQMIKSEQYWKSHALIGASAALEAMPSIPQTCSFESIHHLFPFIKQPTPLQRYAIDEPLADIPQLFILEDVTGAGKTEAALILTQRLLSAGLADGLYVALPTMATANAMYKRLGKVYRRFYDESSLPSLVLAHGASQLSEVFQNSVFLPEQAEDASYDLQEDSASLYCNAWLADNRKKALLADVGVGTLDQALLAVLPVRHQSLRLLGLGRKVLLVDEVHAYDCYMQRLLDNLLEMHARQGSCVILLSATLPQSMRAQLVAAFHRGLDCGIPELCEDKSFPLATHTPSPQNHLEQAVNTRDSVKRCVQVQRLDSEEAVLSQIKLAVAQGQCVCWIRNTVKAARQSYQDLTACNWLDAHYIQLFHSRFSMMDRQDIEEDVLRRFGEQSNNACRKGHVLIATQVVEQSLDLDFDVLITDLAPIDLIIQRAGRLCRHIRSVAGNRMRKQHACDQRGKPILYLFAPEPTDDADENWLKTQQAGTQAVYRHIGQLWLTAKKLFHDQQGCFAMPDDARAMIDGVYAYEAEARIPVALFEESMEAEGNGMMQKSMANLNALKLNKGYTRSSGNWDEESRTPTRLSEQETVSVVLVRVQDGLLSPYAPSKQHAWALSVVNVPLKEWEQAKGHIPSYLHPTIKKLKKEVKTLRWLEVFPLSDETKGFYDACNGWQLNQE